jgi:hypothetical protein
MAKSKLRSQSCRNEGLWNGRVKAQISVLSKWRVMVWPSQSSDLSPVEMLPGDLKQAVHARKPWNITQLNQYCKEERADITPSRCKRLIDSY